MPSQQTFSQHAGLALCACLILAGCAGSRGAAPIVDRSIGNTPAPAVAKPAPAAKAPPVETSGPTYTVRKGDTLYSIALEHGQDYREVAAWNQLEDVNLIRVGQVLRVQPPEGTQAAPIVAPTALESKPLTATPLPPVAAKPEAGPAPKVEPVAARPSEPGAVAWGWPGAGQVIDPFNETRNKGVDIAGKPGDPVLAAGDGKVVYAGSGLRGYGNLVIIKHNSDFLSAYAHNSKIVVKEGEFVKRGTKIAEVGSSDTDRAKLHFEVRRQGKPVDPLKYLPER